MENTIKNQSDELDPAGQHSTNWSQAAIGLGVLHTLSNTQHLAPATLSFQVEATYLITLPQLPHNRTTETILVTFREAPGF